MDNRGDRREHMEDQLRQFNIPFQRKSAYHFSSFEEAQSSSEFHEFLASRRIADTQTEKSRGFVISCFLSHYSIYKQIASMPTSDSTNHYFLILEDDVNIPLGWEDRFASKIRSVPYDFDVLRIGFWGNAREEDKINDDVFMARPPFRDSGLFYAGTHAVVVQSKTIHRFVSKLEDMNIDDIDSMMVNCCDHIQSYALTKDIIERWDSPSDHPNLASKGHNKPTVIIPFKSPFKAEGQKATAATATQKQVATTTTTTAVIKSTEQQVLKEEQQKNSLPVVQKEEKKESKKSSSSLPPVSQKK